MGSGSEPWIDAINRLLRSEDRPDPADPSTVKRWNQGDLATAAGIRPNTLSEILQGSRKPSVETLAKVSEALGVPLWTMFVSERQASLLRDQLAHEELLTKRTTLAEEVRSLVSEALSPIADRLTAAAVARLTPPEPAAPPAPAPTPTPTEATRKRRRA